MESYSLLQKEAQTHTPTASHHSRHFDDGLLALAAAADLVEAPHPFRFRIRLKRDRRHSVVSSFVDVSKSPETASVVPGAPASPDDSCQNSELSCLTTVSKGPRVVTGLSQLASVICAHRSPSFVRQKIMKKQRSARGSPKPLSCLSWNSLRTHMSETSPYLSEISCETVQSKDVAVSKRLEITPSRQDTCVSVLEKRKQREKYVEKKLGKLACAIHEYLFSQPCGNSEKQIRQIFGNNPDSSKALRILLKDHRVKRRGWGGKVEPYVYSVNYCW